MKTVFIRVAFSTPLLFLASPGLAADCSGQNCVDSPGALNIPKVSLGTGATAIANTLILITTVLSAFFIVIAGIRFASSNGNPAQIKSARDTLTYAIAGLVVSILSFFIVGFVLGATPK